MIGNRFGALNETTTLKTRRSEIHDFVASTTSNASASSINLSGHRIAPADIKNALRKQQRLPENADQFQKTPGRKKLEIVAGIDFGTSSTKVVIHTFNYPGNPGFAVNFGSLAHESLDYLLPTKLYVDTSGKCSLAYVGDASAFTNLKVGVIDTPRGSIETVSGPPRKESSTILATAYLALVMRESRKWFLANMAEAFGEFQLNWSFNLGLPAAMDDIDELRNTYNLIGKAAWIASLRDGDISISTISNAMGDLNNARFKTEEMPSDFSAIPEVIAEVVGYARSHYRREGLHVLIDIGAGTVDVCSFILFAPDGDDKYSILTADVERLGVANLHDKRIIGLASEISEYANALNKENDPLFVIPDHAKQYVPQTKSLEEKFEQVEVDFVKDCRSQILKTLIDVKRNRDPNSRHWQKRFPLFLCGGGSALRAYKEALMNVDETMPKFAGSSLGIEQISLPKPDTLQTDISDENYHRLAVAWGLSYQAYNIGDWFRPSEIDDISVTRAKQYDDQYVSKDMV